jgi:hypothetical protein
MAARKKKTRIDWALMTGIATLVTWLLSLCGASFGVYCMYESFFNSPVLEVALLQLIMGAVATYVPYTIYRLFSDMI